jgi:hypothetical protein
VTMTREIFEKLGGAARSHARAKGFPHLADDFAQEALLSFSQGRRVPMAFAWADFLRAEFGRTRLHSGYESRKGAAKSKALLGQKASLVTEEGEERFAGSGDDALCELVRGEDAIRLARAARAVLTDRQFEVYQIVVEQQRTYADAASALGGVHESYISMIMTDIRELLADTLALEDLLDDLATGEPLEWEVQWIAI